ncbi:hypothetical protein LIER_35425 [Lithospermum erythrorhizon]|uniref:Integrase catalytic domain-containing protein n=1 Tax=Lithospermum erythrorhizon TaxID=34254 RepID=A0AAV3NUE2_LITER
MLGIDTSFALHKLHVDSMGFEQIIFEHIPHAQNEEVDHLSRLAITYYDELPEGVYVEVRENPAYEETIIIPVLEEPEDWRTPIAQYLATGQLPESVTEAQKIKNRSFRMGSTQHQPTTSMTPILNPIPFAMWGIDLVEKLPKAKGFLEYVVVAMDYFSKWVETALLKMTGSDSIMKFLWKHVITPFGVPRILVSDNGPQFERPYRINRVIGPGTYELERLNGDVIPCTWHASNLAKYYV